MSHLDSVREAWQSGVEPDLRNLLSMDTVKDATETIREQNIIAAIAEDMRFRWLEGAGSRKTTSDYLSELAEDIGPFSHEAIVQLAVFEWDFRTRSGEISAASELRDRFPEIANAILDSLTATDTYNQLSIDRQADIRKQLAPGSTAFETLDPDALKTRLPNSALDSDPGLLSTQASDDLRDGPRFRGDRDETDQPTRLGRFRVIRKLGSGAFGEVFLGYDDKLQRHVAIKVPRRAFLEQAGVESVLAEARAAAGLDHPGIVTTHDVVEEADGTILIVMEYVDGGTLQDLIDQDAEKGSVLQRMGATFVATVGYEVALALAEAHHHDLIHRDLKPANLMLKDQKLRVTDFGLAVASKDTAKGYELAGTPAYMAPEQIEATPEGLDARADIWSVGVILYQLATGELPFSGNIRELFEKIKAEKPVPPRSIDKKIPDQLEQIILRCLEKNRDDRFLTVLELADEIRSLTVPRPPGLRWECVFLPLGVILTVVGTVIGVAVTASLIGFEQFFSVSELVGFGFKSFVAVALTLGIGPPMTALGNWFCCRRCKALSSNTPTIPCKVSRWAIGSLAAGVASAGFGVPMYLLAIVLGGIAIYSIRRKRRWLTGRKHVAAGLILGFILMIPWLLFWFSFSRIYTTIAARQAFDQAISNGDVEIARQQLLIMNEGAQQYPLTMKGGASMALVYEARLALENGDYEKAIELTDEVTSGFFLNVSIRLCAQIVRATAYMEAERESDLSFEKSSIASSLEPVPVPIPEWAEQMLDQLGPIEPFPESPWLFDFNEEAAPAPPAPAIDPSA